MNLRPRYLQAALLGAFYLFVASSLKAQNRVRPIDLPNKWNRLLQGNMPLVISAPHGGLNNLETVPDRTCDDAVTVTDVNTADLAIEIAERLQAYHGLTPYLIICNISRKDIDPNRELEAGTCGNEKMQRCWEEFHGLIDGALREAVRQHGFCLYIDLHGHGHTEQRLELGYLLDAKELVRFHHTGILPCEGTSVDRLVRDSTDVTKLLFGPRAFGTLMAEAGFPSVPSRQDPFPQAGQKYFGGGYNTRRYTGPDYPHVFGWQIESNMKGVRDKNGRPLFAAAFSRVVVQMLQEQRGWKVPSAAR